MAALFPGLFLISFSVSLAMSEVDLSATGANAGGVALVPASGLFDVPFAVSCAAPASAQVFFSTNGSFPSPSAAARWHEPLAVSRTTVLRVAAFENGRLVGPVASRTYVFPVQVGAQAGEGLPKTWGMTNGQAVAAAYQMDSEIVADPRYRDLVAPALRALPSLFLVIDPEDLFGSEKGLYAHPQESGPVWERSATAELIDPPGPGFVIDCGLRVQGGWNRRPEESPKHAFRLLFHKGAGENRLVYPLFREPGAQEFETVILRAGCNNTWLHWSGEERRRGDYIRDQWMRDTVRAMGHPSARGRFVHLYLNGTYWGIYNLVERPSAFFVAANFGGTPKDYDCRNGTHLLEGTDTAWRALTRLAHGALDVPKEYLQIEQLLDIDEFSDYLLANLYGANADWDSSSNWYAARRRSPPGKFEFFVWDGERTLEDVDANTLNAGDDDSPPGLFQMLRQSAQFRRAFALRAQVQLGPGGALSPERAAERYRLWADQLDLPIVAESARWGAYRQKLHPYKTGPYELYTRDTHWRPEVQRLFRDYFPKRGEELARQLREAGLFSSNPAP